MRKKEWKLVITYHTTTEAIGMEKACKEENMPGRLIPVPQQVSAGCGLAWVIETVYTKEITAFMERHALGWEAMGEYLI